MQKTVNDDIDEIIEILSSPEKSPFKKDAADLLVSPLVLKKARRQLYDNTECSLQKTIAVSLDQDTESDSLPSIESQKSENSRPSSPEELTFPPPIITITSILTLVIIIFFIGSICIIR